MTALIYIITFAPIISWYFLSQRMLKKLREGGRNAVVSDRIEAIPPGFTQAGVLGTFLGIAIGLWGFDVTEIQESVPQLLQGLTGSFMTSIVGIILSIVFRDRCAVAWDGAQVEDDGSDERNADEILRDLLTATRSGFNSMNQKVDDLLKGLVGDGDSSLTTSMSRMRTDARDQAIESRSHLESNLERITGVVQGNHAQILEAVEGFGEQLAKNNVDLLVEAMNKATEQFHNQMKTIVEKLVKENFDELNRSVERMNSWQAENKSMIATMTQQFEDVTKGIGVTGEKLLEIANTVEGMTNQVNQITERTADLTREGGKLEELVTALSQVMVEEDKFNELASMLSVAVTDVKGSSKNMVETSSKLSAWTEENQQMVTSLTAQYDNVVKGFEKAEQSVGGISTSAAEMAKNAESIAVNSEKLTSDNGRLMELVRKLEQVMVEEDKFSELASMLSGAVTAVGQSSEHLVSTSENLRSWTQENQQMISGLTAQYDQVVQGFGHAEQSIAGISTTVVGIVQQVENMTASSGRLTADGGRLATLIGKLEQVMVEEDKFSELAEKLSTAVSNIDKSTGAFKETSKKLESWTKDQKNFRESTESLLKKFDEIAKIKDTNDLFWKDVRNKLNEASDIIGESNKRLMDNLQEINKEFTGELNSMLKSLDRYIQRITAEHTS